MLKNIPWFIACLLISASTVLAIYGCKEITPQPITSGEACNHNIEGLWIGTFADARTAPQFYSLSIKPDGTLTFESVSNNQQHFGNGTWVLNGTTLTCSITTVYGFAYNVGVKQTLTAVFDKTAGTLSSGKWIDTSMSTNSGTFSMKRVD